MVKLIADFAKEPKGKGAVLIDGSFPCIYISSHWDVPLYIIRTFLALDIRTLWLMKTRSRLTFRCFQLARTILCRSDVENACLNLAVGVNVRSV